MTERSMTVDHVGIAVHRLSDAIPRWASWLGPPRGPPEEVPSQGVRVAFLGAGESEVELLEPTHDASAVGRFLEHRGEGLHHLAFEVKDVNRTLAEIIARGERVVDRVGRPGARGRTVGFAHPSAFGGVLVEFVEGA